MKPSLIAACLLALAACQGSSGGAAGSTDKLAALRDEACACTDKACADAVSEKLKVASNEMKEPTDPKVAEAMLRNVTEISACLAKVQSGGEAAPAAPAAP